MRQPSSQICNLLPCKFFTKTKTQMQVVSILLLLLLLLLYKIAFLGQIVQPYKQNKNILKSQFLYKIQLYNYNYPPPPKKEINPNSCHWLIQVHTDVLKTENQSVSGVTTISLTQCSTSPSHRVDQVVDCEMLVHSSSKAVKLLDIGRNWNTLSYTPIQSIPNMLNGWHVRWVCWPCKNWDDFSFQELSTDPCNMGPYIIMLQHEVMVCP